MEQITNWLSAIFLALFPGVVAVVLWSPILISHRLRELFRRLPPTGSAVVGYVIVAIGLSLPFIIGVGIGVAGSTQSVDTANTLLNVAFGLAILYLIGLPVGAVVGLPRVGIDWDQTGYGLSTWLVVVMATLWYVAVFLLPIVFFGFLLALPTGSNQSTAITGTFWGI
ncbi:hypothetical protein [Halorubrum gandharaense]